MCPKIFMSRKNYEYIRKTWLYKEGSIVTKNQGTPRIRKTPFLDERGHK